MTFSRTSPEAAWLLERSECFLHLGHSSQYRAWAEEEEDVVISPVRQMGKLRHRGVT